MYNLCLIRLKILEFLNIKYEVITFMKSNSLKLSFSVRSS